jgi:hypothetical protein
MTMLFATTRHRNRALLPPALRAGLVGGLFALGLGCQSADRAASSQAVPLAVTAPMPATGAAATTAPQADRAMRITVETAILVSRRDAAVSALRAAVSSSGGYVSEGTLSGGDEGGSAKFTVKVPSASVADFRRKLASLGEVRSDSEKAEDVTEARADLRARLHNARAGEQRLLDLLQNHAGNLGDVVLLEKEITGVRETIERMEAEERTLEGQISFATVKVELDTVYVARSPGPGHQIAVAAGDGIDMAKGFLLGTVVFALAEGPTLLIVGAMLYGVFVLVRAWRRRRRRASAGV